MLTESAAAVIAVVIRRIRPSFRLIDRVDRDKFRKREVRAVCGFCEFVVTSRSQEWLDGDSRRPPESIRGPYPNRTQDTWSPGQEHRRGLARRRFCATSGHLAPPDRLGRAPPHTGSGAPLSPRHRGSEDET